MGVLPLAGLALAGMGAGVVGLLLISFLTSVVALARLVSVFSRLVRQTWRPFSSWVGRLGGVLLGSRDWMRGSCMRRDRMWALAFEDSSVWMSFEGCMCLR